jgi:hypothetical protein
MAQAHLKKIPKDGKRAACPTILGLEGKRAAWSTRIQILAVIVFLVVALNCHAAAPASDLCSGAQLIPTNGPFPFLTTAVDTSQATTNGDPAIPSCRFADFCSISRSVWYKFSPGTSAIYTFTTCGTTTTIDDPVMALYSATGSCTGFTEINCDDDDDNCPNITQSTITHQLAAGTQYYIVVWKQVCFGDAGGYTNQLRVTSAPLPQPPTNDTCSGAINIPASGPFPYLTATQDLTTATTAGDPGLPSCQPNVSRSLWYKFLPSSTATYSFTTCAPLTTVPDTVMALYSATGSCTNFTQIDCNDDDSDVCPDNPNQSTITHQLNAGTQYYIVVWKFSTQPAVPGSSTVQLRVSAPPTNDTCVSAITIPASGPFPYLTSTQDVSFATTTGDPPLPSCDTNVSHSTWYKFTPSVTTMYEISTCTNTATTAQNTVMAVYTSANATNPCAGPLIEIPTDGLSMGCDGGSCGGQAVVTTQLSSGTTYYIVVWLFGQDPPPVDSAKLQLRVNRGVPPLNNLCDNATALTLDSPINGTTLTATNAYQLSGSACYTGLSNAVSTAAGRDVVYSFTAPMTANYSFRLSNYTNDLVLYAASDCPAWTGPPATMTGCLAAANRTTASGAEEVMCLPLDMFQQIYVYVDGATSTAASTFTLEVNQCISETEPNGTPDAANDLDCGIKGSISPAGDVDFYSLGTLAAGSRVFASLDTSAANNNTDFELRITTATDTLQYALSNMVAGTPLTSAPAFLRVNHKLAAIAAEPYRLYALVQPPSNSATLETEPNNTVAQANTSANNYFSGKLSSTNDVDTYGLKAGAGNLLFMSLDESPARTNAPVRAVLALLDSNGVVLASVNNPATNATTISGAGSLTATNPVSPAQGLVYRTMYKGIYYARVSIGTNTVSALGAGDYLLSISKFCLTGANLSPVADDQEVDVEADVSTLLTLTGDDLEQESLTFQVTSQPTHGLLSGFNMTTGDILYTPAHGYVGDDGFTFIVNDGTNNSATATISISVFAPFSSVGDGIPDYWRANYFGGNGTMTNNQSCALCDFDRDGMNNLQEYLANTNPTDRTSVFRILSVKRNTSGQPMITWSSVGGTRYRVQYGNGGTRGGYNAVFTDIVRSAQIEIDPNPVDMSATMSFTDDFSLTGGQPPQGVRFYRIRVVTTE